MQEQASWSSTAEVLLAPVKRRQFFFIILYIKPPYLDLEKILSGG